MELIFSHCNIVNQPNVSLESIFESTAQETPNNKATGFHHHYHGLRCHIPAAKPVATAGIMAFAQRLLSTLAAGELCLPPRRFQPPVFQHVCPVDVWFACREDLG
jgi:hypothetical protein